MDSNHNFTVFTPCVLPWQTLGCYPDPSSYDAPII